MADANTILTVLDELGRRLSGPTQEVWAIYVKQYVAYGIGDMVFGTILLLLGILNVVLFFHELEKTPTYSSPMGVDEPNPEVPSLFAVILIGFGAWLIVRGAQFLYNPAFYVIQELGRAAAQIVR